MSRNATRGNSVRLRLVIARIMTGSIPDWIMEWVAKDRLVRNKFKISKKYLRHSKRIQLFKGEKSDDGEWISFHYRVYSDKYGRYNVKYSNGSYHCNCPFFKHRLICSHILGVCQLTGVWPPEKSIFPDKSG